MAEGTSLGAELVTPEAALFRGAATSVVVRTAEGDFTVLAGHTDLVGDVQPGIVRVEDADGSVHPFLVHGGFVQVETGPGAAAGLVEGASEQDRSTRVTVLAGVAEPVGDIDAERAQAARDTAQAALSALASRDDEEARYERDLAERALARAERRLEAVGAAAAH